MFSLLTLRRLLVALLVAIFAANVALFFERLRSGRLLHGHGVLHGSGEGPIPAFTLCFFDPQGFKGSKTVKRREVVLEAMFNNGSSSGLNFEEEDAFWEHRLVAVNSVGGAVFADCHSAVLPFRRSSVSNRFVFVLSPPCDRSETGCVFGFMIQDPNSFFLPVGGDEYLGSAIVFPDISDLWVPGDDPKLANILYTYQYKRIDSRSSYCSGGEEVDFGRCVDKYLKREMPQCSLREGGGRELCKTNDTEAAKRTGEIFDTTPEKMSDVSGCRWSCIQSHYSARRELFSIVDTSAYPTNKTVEGNLIALSIYTIQQVTPVVAEYLSYDLATFVADVGSYLGLLTGAGLPTVYRGAEGMAAAFRARYSNEKK